LGFRIHGLRAIAISTLVATASVTAFAAPAAAIDPAPSESPAPSAAPSSSSSPDPSAPALTATPSPDPAVSPDPTASADPSADPSASTAPAPTLSPAPVPAIAVAPAPTTAPRPDLAAKVVRVGLNQRGDQYRWGYAGPRFFDCSGLVRYSYRQAGVSGKLGGGSSARGMYYWARLHGKTGRRNPQIGDVVVYGRGSHVAIYMGNGRVVHALNPRLDILVTRLHAITTPFTTFIHTDLPRGG